MSETNLSKIKADFKNRLFFYPADALYILEIAKALHLSEKEEYKLFSLMGGAELRNTLPLYTSTDFSTKNINLRINLPKQPEKIRLLIDNLNIIANQKQSDLPIVFALLSNSKDAFIEVFKILTSSPLTYQNMRILPAVQMPVIDKNKNIYEVILYAFNPLNDEWMDYIRRNKRTVKKLSEHHNQLFSGKFGFFSLSKIPPIDNLNDFIKDRVIQGINALQTHSIESDYFDKPEIVKPLIEEFGLLETGGVDIGN